MNYGVFNILFLNEITTASKYGGTRIRENTAAAEAEPLDGWTANGVEGE